MHYSVITRAELFAGVAGTDVAARLLAPTPGDPCRPGLAGTTNLAQAAFPYEPPHGKHTHIRQNALVATAGDADFRRLVRDELGPALAGGGFTRHARRLMWSRQRVEVQHGIALLLRRGSVDIQWAVIVPEATPFIWGVPHPPDDIGYHVLTGSPGDIQHPAAAGSFETSELESEARYAAIAEGVREDIRVMDEFMARFDTRREVRELLLEAARSGIRHFSRSMKGLVVMNAAVLAILDRDPSRYELVEQAVEGLQRFAGPVAAGRIARLRAAVE